MMRVSRIVDVSFGMASPIQVWNAIDIPWTSSRPETSSPFHGYRHRQRLPTCLISSSPALDPMFCHWDLNYWETCKNESGKSGVRPFPSAENILSPRPATARLAKGYGTQYR
jgi:hypothetical protein